MKAQNYKQALATMSNVLPKTTRAVTPNLGTM